MKYYIIAGEASGDLHGSNLMRAILKNDPSAQIRFWGGDAMMAVGGVMVRHIKDLAYMGFVEVAMNLKTVLGNMVFCKKDIETFHPDAIIYIDYPGFNLKIAKWAKQKGFKNFHYISPQVWAWKQGRLPAMRRDLDKLYYILPFEQNYYAQKNMPQAEYVGHPLLDAIKNYHKEDSIQSHQKPIIALLPGSRRQEIKKMLPSMAILANNHPEYEFVVAGMSLLGEAFYHQVLVKSPQNLSYVYDKTYDLLSASSAAIVCSGTATLETALFNVPQVVCYRANPISVAIARKLIGNKIKYISLVNLIADKPIVTELIQKDFSDGVLDKEFDKITHQQDSIQYIKDGYHQVRELLANGEASERVAQSIIKIIS